ncbi:hypothetical protein BXY66_3933 [Shimia isoporae]|uniref:Flp pilus assembly pilin Flp n=1 Tax=Shimia isoporae TaxID=647720 RepID=A0A4R1N2I9_9RHOB|nr:hypothetical protein [Shimia isoporae]TCK99429.1 hypothetical protein BXY66_3933 [Shimia isoporae]
MYNFVKRFRKDDTGAVTVDWVVLTAGVVGLAIGAFAAIESNTAILAGGTADTVAAQEAAPTTIPTTP